MELLGLSARNIRICKNILGNNSADIVHAIKWLSKMRVGYNDNKSMLNCKKSQGVWICIAHNYTEVSVAGMSYHLAHYLASQGYKVLFISHRPHFSKPEFLRIGEGLIHIYSWPTEKRPKGIKSILWYIKLYLKYKPHKTIGHFVGSNITVLISKIFSLGNDSTFVYYHTMSKANLLEWNGSLLRQKFVIYRKKLFYKLFCDYIICPSPLAMEDFKLVYSRDKNCRVIVNPLKDRVEPKSDYHKTESDDIVISYLGRLDPAKGVLELIGAFQAYIVENKDTNIKIQIAGYGTLSDKISEFANEIPNIKIKGRMLYNEVVIGRQKCSENGNCNAVKTGTGIQ